MRAFLVWMTQSVSRAVIAVLLVALGYFIASAYGRGRDLERVCTLLGSHDPSGQAVSAERQVIDAICLGQETEDDS